MTRAPVTTVTGALVIGARQLAVTAEAKSG
jgi:hypothetical protein